MDATKRGRLLIVDDEVELKSALCATLADEGYETVGATSGAEGLQALEKQDFDLLLCALMMPRMDGIEVLRKALEIDPTLVGIMMTGQGTIPSAVEAMKVGAFDYLLKPFDVQTMRPILERAMETRRLRAENVRLRQYVDRLLFASPRYQLIGSGSAMQKVVQLIEKVAPTDATVFIRGERGTGKELVARALHHNSPRRGRAKSSHLPENMLSISRRTSLSSRAWSCLVRILPWQDLAFFKTDTANRRSKAKFSWPWPLRVRLRSSSNTMSNTQCSEFSIPQCPRI